GVIDAQLSLREAIVRIVWDPRIVKLSAIARTLSRFGSAPHPAKGQSRKELLRRDERKRMIHLAAAGAISGNLMLLALALYAGMFGGMEEPFRQFFRWISTVLGTIALAWPGAVFFRSALAALRARTINLDVPIALALLVGGAAGALNVTLNRGEIYFDSLSVLVFLLLIGRFLQYRQQRRADTAVELLFSLTPSTCRIVHGDDVIDSPIEALSADDLVEVRSGDLIPADGIVESGASSVNQALLTGESQPIDVHPGDAVFGGSQNLASVLRVRVTAAGRETRVGRLMNLIERGVADKPPIVQFVDRVGAWFVIGVSLLAAMTFAWWCRAGISQAIDHSVALLIVTCPCVLGLATPLTVSVAIGRLAQRKILVKSGAALERLSDGGEMILDKTGTITEGQLQLLEWFGDKSIAPAVAALEASSTHPVARALASASEDGPGHDIIITETIERDGGIGGTVYRHAEAMKLDVGSPRYMRRRGVLVSDDLAKQIDRAQRAGLATAVAAVDGSAVAVLTLGDRVRRASKDAIESLNSLGWRPSILSGDAQSVVHDVATCVGIESNRAISERTPEEKLAAVHEASARGVTVMVGDGVNDAAALAAATVGIAVHGGAEASLAAADVYIARPGLEALVELCSMSRRTMRIVRRNLFISLAYNVLAAALAVTGVMNPLIAAILMPLSSATVLTLAVTSIGRPAQERC
ncbi:MAG TPA: cation-translocating P-type ATPase, partial [Tepidisphaeraceae bacterium]|nr:cation-translocating P-type ATPase [Tepidisphaeraceae bacterium]